MLFDTPFLTTPNLLLTPQFWNFIFLQSFQIKATGLTTTRVTILLSLKFLFGNINMEILLTAFIEPLIALGQFQLLKFQVNTTTLVFRQKIANKGDQVAPFVIGFQSLATNHVFFSSDIQNIGSDVFLVFKNFKDANSIPAKQKVHYIVFKSDPFLSVQLRVWHKEDENGLPNFYESLNSDGYDFMGFTQYEQRDGIFLIKVVSNYNSIQITTGFRVTRYKLVQLKANTLVCPNSQPLLQNSLCFAACSAGFFQSGQTCNQCLPMCLVCQQVSVCTTCFSTFVYNNNTCFCLPSQFQNAIENVCQQCSITCVTCISATVCTSCQTTQTLQAGSCICLPPQVVDSLTGICKTCPLNCNQCLSLTSCQACRFPFRLVNSQCLCPDQTYLAASIGQCQPCPLNCQLCGSDSDCIVCKYSFQADEKNDGSCRCPLTGFFYDSTDFVCKGCPLPCLTCWAADLCVDCRQGFSINIGACDCQASTFLDITTLQCSPCSPECEICSSQQNCYFCHEGFIRIGSKCQSISVNDGNIMFDLHSQENVACVKQNLKVSCQSCFINTEIQVQQSMFKLVYSTFPIRQQIKIQVAKCNEIEINTTIDTSNDTLKSLNSFPIDFLLNISYNQQLNITLSSYLLFRNVRSQGMVLKLNGQILQYKLQVYQNTIFLNDINLNGQECRQCDLTLQIQPDSVMLNASIAFPSRTQYTQLVSIYALSQREKQLVLKAKVVGDLSFYILHVIISVLICLGLLNFVGIIYKQINYFMVLGNYSAYFPPNFNSFTNFLKNHSNIFFPTFIEQRLQLIGMLPQEAAIFYLVVTILSSLVIRYFFNYLKNLIARKFFSYQKQFIISFRDITLVIEFLPMSVLLTSNIRFDDLAKSSLRIMNIVVFHTIWLSLIFILFLYKWRTTNKRRNGQSIINLITSLTSFFLGLMYSFSLNFQNIVFFLLAFFALATVFNVLILRSEPTFTIKSLLVEHALYLALSAILLLVAFNKSSMTIGWILICFFALFLLLNLWTIFFKLKILIKKILEKIITPLHTKPQTQQTLTKRFNTSSLVRQNQRKPSFQIRRDNRFKPKKIKKKYISSPSPYVHRSQPNPNPQPKQKYRPPQPSQAIVYTSKCLIDKKNKFLSRKVIRFI